MLLRFFAAWQKYLFSPEIPRGDLHSYHFNAWDDGRGSVSCTNNAKISLFFMILENINGILRKDAVDVSRSGQTQCCTITLLVNVAPVALVN